MPRISMEYWSAFVCVVEQGSFARAAEAMSKSQSAISYAIAQLEGKLPEPLFVAEGRRAILTPIGEVMYRRAKQLLTLACDVEMTAEKLADGWERKITIAVDVLVDIRLVLKAMCLFSEVSPQTRVTLLETSLSGTDEAVLERRAEMALMTRVPPGMLATPIGEIRKVLVVHPNHPLASSAVPLSTHGLRHARQIVVRDSGNRREQDRGWLDSEKRLTVSHFSTSLQAVEAGLGFAFLPHHLVEDGLKYGRLVQLGFSMEMEQRVPFYLVYISQEEQCPSVKFFAEQLAKIGAV